MGRVFSWEEIARGNVPKIRSFKKVADEIRAVLASTEGVLGAVICGSALSGNVTVRSDIDCVVVYEWERRTPVLEALQSLYRVASWLHVPIEFIPIDSEVAAQGLHTIGPSFARHLERAARNGGIIKNDPLVFICFPGRGKHDDLVEDVLGYLKHKIRRFEKGLVELPTMNAEPLCRFLQKALESPIHIARKVLHLSVQGPFDDSREEVKKLYPRMADEELAGVFQGLVQEDEEYSLVIGEQLLEPREREGRYVIVFEQIKRRASWAFLFARANAFFVLNKFP